VPEEYIKQARIFKAMADENRLRILDILKTGEHCGCRLLEAMKITQSTLSHHMKILCDAGIVACRKDGIWMNYSISKEGMKVLTDWLNRY
jgi:ArsR family transcriptional regulator